MVAIGELAGGALSRGRARSIACRRAARTIPSSTCRSASNGSAHVRLPGGRRRGRRRGAGGCAGGRGIAASVRFGDVAIYHALLAALPFSPQWRDRLRRAFSRRKGPRELLDAAAKGQVGLTRRRRSIGALPQADAVIAVEAELRDLVLEPVARSAADIAQRLREKAADIAPDAGAAAALVRVP